MISCDLLISFIVAKFHLTALGAALAVLIQSQAISVGVKVEGLSQRGPRNPRHFFPQRHEV